MIEISNIFDAFKQLNILVVGDVMIDRYVEGKVTRISPEAPVPVVHLEKTENRLGGAANVALNIKALGANPIICSMIGDDDNGALFQELLPEFGLSNKHVLKSTYRTTTVKTRVLSSNQHLLRVDEEDASDLIEADRNNYLDRIREILDNKEIHVILFQDYNKGVLSYEVIRSIILEAIKRDIPTAVDPKYHNFWAYKHVTLFKPNLKEIRDQIPEVANPTEENLNKASFILKSKLGNQYTMITLSEKGLFVDSGKESMIVGTQPRSIADVCGAGDTVISVAALGLALNMDLKEMAYMANLAGGQVCEKVGVVPVDKNQLEREFQYFNRPEVMNGLGKH